MKRLPVILAIAALLLGMVALLAVACGGESTETTGTDTSATDTTAAGTDDTVASVEPVEYKFATLLYSYEDAQGLYVKAYTKYLSEYFATRGITISWDYLTAFNADQAIDAVETECAKGVDCIFSSLVLGFDSWTQICEQNQVYFTMAIKGPEPEDMDTALANPYYVGSACVLDFTESGRAWAEYLNGLGYKSFMVTGFIPGVNAQCQQLAAGIKEVLDEKAVADPEYTYQELMVPPQDAEASFNAMLNDPSKQYDIIFSTIATPKKIIAQVYQSGKQDSVKVAGINADQTCAQAFQDGFLVAIADNLVAEYGINVVLAINALQGDTLPGTAADKNILPPMIEAYNLEEFQTYSEYVMNADYTANAFTGDELAQFVLAFNPDATWDALQQFVAETSVTTVAERHAGQ